MGFISKNLKFKQFNCLSRKSDICFKIMVASHNKIPLKLQLFVTVKHDFLSDKEILKQRCQFGEFLFKSLPLFPNYDICPFLICH